MKYLNGNDIALTDPVWWNEGANVGRVSQILEKKEQWNLWGLDEPGVFVCMDFSGKTMTDDVFISQKEFEVDGFEQMTLEEDGKIKEAHAKLCLINPNIKSFAYSILCHKVKQGIKWIFVISCASFENKQFYAIYENTSDIVKITKEEVYQ